MFKILSDLSLLLRKELPIDNVNNSVVASGLAGLWVTLDSSGYAQVTTGATELAWPIWNESSRTGAAAAMSPDVTITKKVTVLAGKYFATTNMYSGVTVTGALKTGADGKLVPAVEGTATNVVAYCIKAPYSTTYLGTTFNVIDIYVL